VTDAIEEGDMPVEDEEGTERAVESDASDAEPQSAAEAADDDDVEAHVWRAQS
jgi:hypothetical protein